LSVISLTRGVGLGDGTVGRAGDVIGVLAGWVGGADGTVGRAGDVIGVLAGWVGGAVGGMMLSVNSLSTLFGVKASPTSMRFMRSSASCLVIRTNLHLFSKTALASVSSGSTPPFRLLGLPHES